MGIIRLNEKAPHCPLCIRNENAAEHFMDRDFSAIKGFAIYSCPRYKVAIRTDDPFVNKWEQALELTGKIECPNCNAGMRYFATSTGYMKAVCPKKSCGATLGSAEKDREVGVTVGTPDKPGDLQ